MSFKSYSEPILILLAAIPFCHTGAILGHLIMGHAMSMLSSLEIFAAAGVAMNDNLVLLDYVHKLREQGMDGAEALVEAGTRRFRPILLTSLTTFIGLMPLLLERSIQAQWLIPIGISLAFGVLFALFVTLFFVPALYGIGADIRRGFKYLTSGTPQLNFPQDHKYINLDNVGFKENRGHFAAPERPFTTPRNAFPHRCSPPRFCGQGIYQRWPKSVYEWPHLCRPQS